MGRPFRVMGGIFLGCNVLHGTETYPQLKGAGNYEAQRVMMVFGPLTGRGEVEDVTRIERAVATGRRQPTELR